MFDAVLTGVKQAFAGVPQAAPFLQDWPQHGVTRTPEPVQLPVCRWLDQMGEAGVVGALRAAAPGLCWRQTYGVADFGPEFLVVLEPGSAVVHNPWPDDTAAGRQGNRRCHPP